MRLHLLGQPHLELGDKVLPLSKNHSQILAWLTMHQKTGLPMPRVRLARAIWTDCTDEQGRKRLANSLYRLRQEIPEIEEFMIGDATSLALQPMPTDALEFQKLMQSQTPQDWFQALEMYQGDLLEGEDVPWLDTWRVELHQTLLQGLRQAIQQADSSRAILLSQRLIQLEPWNEEAHTHLIRLYADNQRLPEAISAYEKLADTLKQEFSSQPRPETQVFVKDLERQLEQQNSQTHQIMVGRSLEWRSLTNALNAVKIGQGGIILVEGEPGLGKTRLLLELKSLSAWHNVSALYGAAANSTPAYAPLEQSLRGAAVLLEQATPLIQKNLEPLLKTALDNEAQANPQLVSAALERWLRHLEQPTVWLLDDLHWAGDLFWNVLKMLARVSQQRPVLLVICTRSQELRENQKAFETLLEIRQNQQAMHHALGGLSLEECTQLARGQGKNLGNKELEQMHRISAGNPLVFQELVLGNSADNHLSDAFQSRFSKLDKMAREALEAASVLGKHLDLNTWEAMLGVQPPITQLLETRFLHKEPELGFQHDLTRVFVYEQMKLETRQKWHGLAFEVLKTQQTRAAVLAHHAEEAGLLAESVEHYRNAVSEALNLNAFQEASRLLKLGFLYNQQYPNQLETMHLKLLQLQLAQVQTASLPEIEDLESLEQSARKLQVHDLVFKSLQMQFDVYGLNGNHEKAELAANTLIKFTQETNNQEKEITALTKIALLFAKTHFEAGKGLGFALRAYNLCQNTPISTQLQLQVLIAVINTRMRTKEYELAWEILVEAEELVVSHPDLVGSEFLLLNTKGNLANTLEHYELAVTVFQKQHKLSYSLGDNRAVEVTLANLADVLKKLGRFEEALVWAEEFSQMMPAAKNWQEESKIAYYFSEITEILVRMGRLNEAKQILQPLEKWIKEGATSIGSKQILHIFLQVHRTQGTYQEGLEFLKAVPETMYTKLIAAELYYLAGFRYEAELRISQALAEPNHFSKNFGTLSLFYTAYVIYQQAIDLEKARFALLRFTSHIETLENRQIMLKNVYYAKAIEAAWQQQTLETTVIELPALTGEGTITITWTLSSGASDKAHLEQHGKVALRNHRLKRLMLEAQAQGAKALQRELATVLGVTVRTIEADIAQLKTEASVPHAKPQANP